MREGCDYKDAASDCNKAIRVTEGANEKASQAQHALWQLTITVLCLFFFATRQFLLSWLELTLLEAGTPTSHTQNNLLQALAYRTSGHSGQQGRLSSTPPGSGR